MSLDRASPTQLRWIEQISGHLAKFRTKPAEIYMMFKLDETRAAFACLRPLAHCLRLYTLLDPDKDPRLRRGTSTRSFKRWGSEYDIVREADIPGAEDLINLASNHPGAQKQGRSGTSGRP